MKKYHLLNGIQIHLSMKVENQPQQKKEYSVNLRVLLKGLHKEFPEEDRKHWSTDHWAMKQQTLDRRRGRKKWKKNWLCLMKMLHHVCLIPFCIIDMNYWYDSCKVFFKQLINLLLSMLPQRVPDLDKKLNSPFFFSLGLSVGRRPFASEPLYEETCNALWTKMETQNLVLNYKKKKKKRIRTSALPELMRRASQVKM